MPLTEQIFLTDYTRTALNSTSDTDLKETDNLNDAFSKIEYRLDNSQSKIIECECLTIATESNKIITRDDTVLVPGDVLSVKFVNGNAADNVTIDFNEIGPKFVLIGGKRPIGKPVVGMGHGAIELPANGKIMFQYDGTYMNQFGSMNSFDKDTTNITNV
jgi:hypothetical protein